jgi:hypothetical protein
VTTLTAPFFEIGPKNLMRRAELLALARSAEAAAAEYGVTTILTLPVALIYLVKTAHPRLLVFAQTMSTEIPGPSVGAVIAESLVDAGADGVAPWNSRNSARPSTGRRVMACRQSSAQVISAKQYQSQGFGQRWFCLSRRSSLDMRVELHGRWLLRQTAV